MAETNHKPINGTNKHAINSLMEATLAKVRELGDAETIIGKPVVTPGGVTIIPVSKLTCGFGAGGSDYNTRHNANAVLFGGGGGGMPQHHEYGFHSKRAVRDVRSRNRACHEQVLAVFLARDNHAVGNLGRSRRAD